MVSVFSHKSSGDGDDDDTWLFLQGRSEITPAAYMHFTHMLKQLADGKLVLLTEV